MDTTALQSSRSHQLALFFRRMLIFFGVMNVLGIIRMALPVSEDVKGNLTLTVFIVTVILLPKARINPLISLVATLAIFGLTFGLAFLARSYTKFSVDLTFAVVSGLMAAICGIIFWVAMRRSEG